MVWCILVRLYLNFPFILGAQSYKHSVNCDDVEAAEEYTIVKPAPVSSELLNLFELIMTEDEIEVPSNTDEGLILYRHLRSLLE